MLTRPYMAIQFAKHLKQVWASKGYPNVTVHAKILVRLNGRQGQHLIDPEVDLAAQEWSFLSSSHWLLPLHKPLPPE